ncbi:MAG: DUF4860 domain-containing protein [Oscillospiraceae bacterium]|jgi:hypothetical protein|nr:DUF4860 domain-containing protein [Oscillospiraceae bacterium]
MKRYIHTVDAVFALILFCAFALSMLMVLMTGAGAYKNIRGAVRSHYSEDTCVSYIAMKLRHYDGESSSVSLGEIEGEPALFLTETIEETAYITAIYYHDGSVRELFAEAGYNRRLDDGLEIVEAQSLKIDSPSDGVFSIECVGAGGVRVGTTISLRSAEVGA